MGKGGRSVLVALAAAALLAMPAGAAAKSRKVSLPLPGPGRTVLAVTQLRFEGSAPRELRPKLVERAKLGPAYRGLYAIYRRRRGRTTTLTFLTLVLRSESAADRRPRTLASSAEPDDSFQLVLFFSQVGIGPSIVTLSYPSGDDTPTRPPAKLTKVLAEGGVDTSPSVRNGDLGDDVVDTGHYDDGHAFGWRSAGTEKALGNWLHLSSDNAPYEELIEQIERNLAADLDGDGEVGDRGGGGQVDTVVAPPVITQP